MSTSYLTTKDNPYNPKDDFILWYMFDVEHGYNSCSYLDRIAKTSDVLSDEETEMEIERAIDEIIKLDFTNNYLKLKYDENGTLIEPKNIEKQPFMA